MAKMSEIDSDRQQIERLTDVVRPPKFAESVRAGMSTIHFESVSRAILYGRKPGHDDVSIYVTSLCGGANMGEPRSPLRHEVTCGHCLKLLAAVKREIA